MSRLFLLPILTLALVAPIGAAAADADLWLHVRVEEGDDTKVVINLPFSLIGKALPMVDIGDRVHGHSIHFDDHRFTYVEMRDLWLDLRDGPDMEFVTVEERDETVRIWKEEGYLHVRVRKDRDRRGERVDVRMPVRVVDAFLSGESDFDLEAAVVALAEHGVGELVAVHEDDESVRVWVDTEPESGD